MSERPRRGPGMRTRLVLVSLVVLVLPWLLVRYQREADAFVLEGRKQAVALVAQGIATVLHDRADLFDESGGLPIFNSEPGDFNPLPLEAPVQLDGNGRDWSFLSERRHASGAAQTLRPATGEGEGSLSFDLSLGRRGDYLYALFEVRDDIVTYRPERYRNLDASDHLRITLRDADDELRRYVVTALEDGAVSAYEVGESWRYALGDGLPELRVRGHWRTTRFREGGTDGYTVELRFPLEMLRPRFEVRFAVADVDRRQEGVTHLVGTFSQGVSDRLNLVLFNSPEILRILGGLDLPGARISVIDARMRVRAEVGTSPDAGGAAAREALLAAVLAPKDGVPGVASAQAGEDLTRAVSPILQNDRVAGAVLIEQSNAALLAKQRAALEDVLRTMGIACVAVVAVLWLFAWRVTRRIHRLRDEAQLAIDAHGRLRATKLEAERRAPDEIGDLSRTVTGLLGRLDQYTSFLERIPRTLRHEISNPLNALSTSLHNLIFEHPEIEGSRYIASANRGVARVTEILQSLTDAASLEQALHSEQFELVDLAQLVTSYVTNFASLQLVRGFSVRGADTPVLVEASAFRLEQLLDKLVDNAVAFSPAQSEILVALQVSEGSVQLDVENEGPLLPEDLRERLFESMTTSRGAGGASAAACDDRPHLGIGLYVVRLIGEHLGGSVHARNRDDGLGVVASVRLPLADLDLPRNAKG